MGVRGLKSFIRKNDDLLIKNHELHDTTVVVDACNLVSELIRESQKHERPDLFGGNMVQFANYVKKFFQNLNKCNIYLILVFDGAQTRDNNTSKTPEKQRRAFEYFQNVMSINRIGFGDFILPATATNVFRSIAVDNRIRIVQCMYEADLEVAHLAEKYKCPVISNDSDFYLIDLPYGLIPTDLIHHKEVLVTNASQFDEGKSYHYILCDLYKQDNFTCYFPQLDKKCLPLLGVMVGNDYISARVFEKICSQLPMQRIRENYGVKAKMFRKVTSKQHEKILKILYYLCDKTLNENINQICLKVPKDNRQSLKRLIRLNLLAYDIPKDDIFDEELIKLYKPGFYATYSKKYPRDELDLIFRETMLLITKWLRHAMERSVLSYRCLELAHRNKVFLRSQMDDSQLPSAHTCQIRTIEVMLSLLRSSFLDTRKPCIVFDRISKESYGKIRVYPRKELDNFGPINYLFYDVPKLAENVRLSILLATFHYTLDDYSENIIQYFDWFDSKNAEEFLLVKLILRFIDIENPNSKLWSTFKRATLLCIIYYRLKMKSDFRLNLKLGDSEFVEDFFGIVDKYKYAKTPQLSKKRLYNSRLMHQITQFQTSLMSFNLLNAFLGDVMTRVRSENWLNSCLIYNLTENLRQKRLQHIEKKLPSIAYY